MFVGVNPFFQLFRLQNLSFDTVDHQPQQSLNSRLSLDELRSKLFLVNELWFETESFSAAAGRRFEEYEVQYVVEHVAYSMAFGTLSDVHAEIVDQIVKRSFRELENFTALN